MQTPQMQYLACLKDLAVRYCSTTGSNFERLPKSHSDNRDFQIDRRR